MGIVAVIVGGAAIAVGIFAKEFYEADVATGLGLKRKSSTWSGRVGFIGIGLFFIALGIKLIKEGG